MTYRPFLASTLMLFTLSLLQACGDSSKTADTAAPASEPAALVQESSTSTEETEVAAEVEEIEPDELEPSGEIELKQYTVAYMGSGTLGGGTLTVDGETYPFKISGLGIGGIGASSVDAEGVVYNLPNLDAFPGTYGNARLGMTAGDSGSGKLWLKSSTGVVIELESEMRGLALNSGLDGIFIDWDDGGDSNVDKAVDGTEEVVGEGIEKGADAVQKGVDNVKGWLKGDG